MRSLPFTSPSGIERANEAYRPYDTYAAWKGSFHAIRRLLAAWIILTFLPLLQFAVTISLLSGVNLSFDLTFTDVLVLVVIGFLSFFQFGYYRIFEAIINLRPAAFFPDNERQEFLNKERQEFWSHFIPGVMYVAASSLLLLLILLIQNP